MKRSQSIPIALAGLLVFAATGTLAQTPIGSGFNYSGQLKNGGSPVNGDCDFQFSLWDAAGTGSPPAGGAQVGATQSLTATVKSGLFTVVLNSGGEFGTDAFADQARWLQTSLRCPVGSGVFTTLSPRQMVSPAPLALALPGLYTLQNPTSPNVVGGHMGNTVPLTVSGATIGGGGRDLDVNQVSASFGTVAGGIHNAVTEERATVGGGQGNTASGVVATVSGGLNNAASGPASSVGGGSYNASIGDGASVGGGRNNVANGDGAGVATGKSNTASGASSAVAGGRSNHAAGDGAAVSGGGFDGANTFGNVAIGVASTIGGGLGNVVSGTAGYAVVGGGRANETSGYFAVVAGGYANVASANAASIGGGQSNVASAPGATIGGGGWNGTSTKGNMATAAASTIAGGLANVVSPTAAYGVIGGGHQNIVSGAGSVVGGGGTDGFNFAPFWANRVYGAASAILGGVANTISNTANYASLAGGQGNTVLGGYGTIGGGANNIVSGVYGAAGGGEGNFVNGARGTVPGGSYNSAYGDYSFAAGRRAKAVHQGAFVWADATDADFASTANNQFLIRTYAVGINTNAPARTLDVNGAIGVFDNGTRTYNGGLASEVNGQLVEVGINDDGINRFGGTYSQTAQGGLIRVDARAGQNLFQFYGRAAGNTSLTSLATLNTNGRLAVTGGFNGACRLDGSVAGGPICNQDVAEVFGASTATEPGDLVVLDVDRPDQPTVKKSTKSYESRLIGVVSANPGLVFDNGETHLAGDNASLITKDKTVVAAFGRVLVKLSLENGPVSTGDALAASSTPGMAMRASRDGQIVGYALQGSNRATDGKLLMWLQVGYFRPDEASAPGANASEHDTAAGMPLLVVGAAGAIGAMQVLRRRLRSV